jgi:hypothetical protein
MYFAIPRYQLVSDKGNRKNKHDNAINLWSFHPNNLSRSGINICSKHGRIYYNYKCGFILSNEECLVQITIARIVMSPSRDSAHKATQGKAAYEL